MVAGPELAARYAAAWSSGDPDQLASYYAPEGRLFINDGLPAVGRLAIAEVARSFMTELPDMKVVCDRLEQSGDRTHFHWTLTGSASGPGGSGRPIHISGHEDWLVGSDGLIVESRGHMDSEDYARQLGG
jgi:uncharacterized protein (TIGR02246 family)